MIQGKPAHSTQTPQFSLSATRQLVADCFHPRPWIYWTDFTITYGLGLYCFQRVRGGSLFQRHQGFTGEWTQIVFFFASSLLFYRASMFIHELVHQRGRSLTWFSVVWNVFCGIPFLIPTFVYYSHIDHHRRAHYGTHDDGEYLPLRHRKRWYILFYLSWTLVIPLVAVARFMILSPLTWINSSARRWVHQRLSSMVMDPSYIRPLPPKATLQMMRIQEFGCFLWCWSIAIVPPIFLHRWPVPFLVHAYLTGLVVLILNSIRTLGSHRWRNEEGQMTFVEQLLDSVNYPDRPWITEAWGPLGSRYHALHHLFPSMPYHEMPRAHRQLMVHLPDDSPYRQTNSPSLTATILELVTASRVKKLGNQRGPAGLM